MQLEKVFELVRKEEVVLWIGSGFSLYAGYPSGQKLSEIIYQSLSPAQKNDIPPSLSLAELAEQYVRLKSGDRTSLYLLLQKEFLKLPVIKKWHQVLAKIPHIKTIVTTNYERLFELAYGEELQTIIFPADVVNLNSKTELFKVHGDINHLQTLTITRSDYTDFFFQKREEDIIWTVIKERISNKHVLFIGYDLEDENVKAVLRQISESLGKNQKEMFLIAPGFKQHKIQYLSSLGIQYLNFKGEVFVEKLYDNVRTNITADFAKGYISPETLRKFFAKNNLTVELKAIENQYEISTVKCLKSESIQIAVKFKNDIKFADSFYATLEGRAFGQLIIDGAQLEQLQLLLNQVNVVDDQIDRYQLRLTPKAKKEGRATLVFDDGIEFENISYQLFISKRLLSIVGKYKNSEFSIQVDGTELSENGNELGGSLKYTRLASFDNVNDAIAVTKLCIYLAKGSDVTIYIDDNSEGIEFKRNQQNYSIKNLESNLEFFESLKKIESYYKVRFTNFEQFTEEDFDNVYKAMLFANKQEHVQGWDEELVFTLDKDAPIELLLKIEEGAQFTAESQNLESLQIYGQAIQLGYQVAQPLDLFIVNKEEVINKNTTKVIVRSRSKKIRLYYQKATLKELQQQEM